MMAEGHMVDVHDLPESLLSRKPQDLQGDDDLLPLSELDRRHARRVLERMNGNKLLAAKILQVSRTTLYRLLDEHEPPQ